MPLRNLFEKLADNRPARSGWESALQGALSGAALAYAAGASTARLLYEAGLRERTALPVPVLSVGNLTLGGTGKTPFAAWLVGRLREAGRHPVILSRGYGREDEERLVVVHDGTNLLANTREAGDEPVLLARLLGNTPVLVCADRVRAGRLALRRFTCDTVVLDDGFQHHRLSRDGDIVLLDATRPVDRLRLFPRGTLREPVSALSRAHLVVITRCGQAAENARRLARLVRTRFPHVPCVRTDVAIRGARCLATRQLIPADELRGRRATVVCGVGNPAAVRRSVEALGVRIAAFHAMADHARLTRRQLLRLEGERRDAGASMLLVTEKDAVKLAEVSRPPEGVFALVAELTFASQTEHDLAERVIRSRLESRRLRGFLPATVADPSSQPDQ